MADDEQYYAQYGNPPETVPWALFKTVGVKCLRYVKHRGEYLELAENWDFISGHSSESFGAQRITPEQAALMEPDIPDMEPAVVKYFGG